MSKKSKCESHTTITEVTALITKDIKIKVAL